MPRSIEFDRTAVMERITMTFWAKGYRNTGVRDLTEATGLNESSLYNTFGNKHAIFMEALTVYQSITAGRLAHYAATYGPREALERTWRWLGHRAADPKHHGCMLSNAARELGAEDEAVLQYVREQYDGLERAFRELIERGQAAGEISTKRSAEQLAQFFVVAFQGINASTAFSPDADRTQNVVDSILAVLD